MVLAINKDTIADLAGSEFKGATFVGMQNLGGKTTVDMAENVAQVSNRLDGAVGPNALNEAMRQNPVNVNLTPNNNNPQQAENNDVRPSIAMTAVTKTNSDIPRF